jgi:cysteinyl-tRNA synthetase
MNAPSPQPPLRLYNTLTKREEVFAPIDATRKPPTITFYSCGPTVYDFAHIGNFRSFLNADVLRRTLELLGYTVRQVMNITDVGHMTDNTSPDAGGEDRMQVAGKRLLEAKKSGKLPGDASSIDPSNPYAIADFYASAFLDDARALGLKIAFDQLKHPELMPRPTRYIPQMIAMIQTLIDRKHAYVARDGSGGGVVYFDVMSFPEYGKLSGNTPDTVRAGEGGRVDEKNQAMKKHPADFMLWKADPKHIMKWDSPWGAGYPGWHIECSVMARSLLGDEIDLHSGGEDNIFPHHECEIAQSCCATGLDHFACFWFHTRFLLVDGDKMSKSKGNFYTLRDLLAKGATPAAVRLELIKTHYRSNSNFTMQGLTDSQRMIERWGRVREQLKEAKAQASPNAGPLAEALPMFVQSLCSDLNIAGAIGVLNEAIGRMSDVSALNTKSELAALDQMNSVLGVLDLEREASTSAGGLDASMIEAKIAERAAARKNKDFKRGDDIRNELLALGIEIKDSAQGTTWTRSVK